MCTWLSQQVEASGAARGVPDWMRVTAVNVMYDHPVSAPYDHALLLDFINPSQGVGARVGIELSAELGSGTGSSNRSGPCLPRSQGRPGTADTINSRKERP